MSLESGLEFMAAGASEQQNQYWYRTSETISAAEVGT
jgi:hypothetical protein